ncbi:MAG: vWA domain-containing protein [Bacillota bacterium]
MHAAMDKNRFLVLFVLFTSFLFPPACAYGQQPEDIPDRVTVALIIDGSGSMKSNDPDKVRISAAQKVVEMLGDDDGITVVQFADRPSVLIPLTKAGAKQFRGKYLTLVTAIGASGNTDIKGALEAAFAELNGGEGKRFALLLSDGEPDLPPLVQDQRRMNTYLNEVSGICDAYKTRGWAVHSIALHRKEAGPLLRKIAQQTGGEYFFVPEAAALESFFQSIFLVQKHDPVEKLRLDGSYAPQSCQAGGRLPVEAWLRLGRDRLIPGPHLTVEELALAATIEGRTLASVNLEDNGREASADKVKGDGVFSGWLECRKEGRVTLSLTMEGVYRGQKVSEKVTLGQVNVLPAHTAGRTYPGLAGVVVLPAGGGVILLCLLAVVLYIWRNRLAARIKGALKYRVEGEGGAGGELDLTITKKNEVVIATENGSGADFVLPVKNGSFSFKIKKMTRTQRVKKVEEGTETEITRKGTYMAISFPGTFIIFQEAPGVFSGNPRSRKQIAHGDRFKVRGYEFEFDCPEAKASESSGGKETSSRLTGISERS